MVLVSSQNMAIEVSHEIIEKYHPFIIMEFEEENIRQCGLTKEGIISFIKN